VKKTKTPKPKSKTDQELMDEWKLVTDPLEALGVLQAHSTFVGSDPYYRDLNDALWDMVDRVLAAHEPKQEISK
jgi:hypothetical protein